MSEELEKIGVDVWMCCTIYVDAEADEEAEEIVKDQYANECFHFSGDIEMNDDDFMSAAVTFYGLGREQKLVPDVDPVRDAAPDMLAALKEAQAWLVGMVDSNEIHDDERACLERIDAAIAKAEGAK